MDSICPSGTFSSRTLRFFWMAAFAANTMCYPRRTWWWRFSPPLTAQFDRGYKKRAYEKFGVREYWLVCPVSRTVETYLLKNGVLEFDRIYSVYPDWMVEMLPKEEAALIPTEFTSDLFPGLRFKLADIFGGMVAEIRQRCKEKENQ